MKPTKSQFEAQKPEAIVQQAGTVGAIANELQAKHDAIAGTQGKIAGNFTGTAAEAEAKAAASGLQRLADDIGAVRKLQNALQTGGQGLVDAKGKVNAALAETIGLKVDDNWAVSYLTTGPYTPLQISHRQSVQEKINNAVNAYSQADDNAANLISAACGTSNGGKGVDWGKVLDNVLSANGEVSQEVYKWDPKERKTVKEGNKVWRPGEGFSTPEEKEEGHKKGPSASAMWNLLDESVVRKEGKTEFGVGDLEGEASYRLDLLQGTANAGLVYKDGKVGFAAGAEVNLIKTQAGVKVGAGPVSAEAGVEASVGADASISATVGKDGLLVDAGAFAGGKAGAEGSLTVAGVKTEAGAEVSYGVGAEGNIDAGYHDGKFELGFKGNVTVGLGIGIDANISVDPKAVAGAAKDAGDSIADQLNPFPELTNLMRGIG